MKLGNSAFRRYQVIDDLLRNSMRKYPSMEDIIDACEEKLGKAPMPETIQKDISRMKLPRPEGFDAPIVYNRSKSGYEYADKKFSISNFSVRPDDLNAIYEAAELLRFLAGSGMGDGFSHAAEKVFSVSLEKSLSEEELPILQTMKPPPSRGFEHFKLFFAACKDRYPVSFIHFSYKKRVFNHRIIHPFLIKEFENRWYVIGHSESHGEVRTYGLDRIFEPIALEKKYIKSPRAEIEKYLNQVYGVYPLPTAKFEKVQIEVSSLATHYFQAYPIHESQQIEKKGDGTSLISFELVPTVELARYLHAQGNQIRIKKPIWFKNYKIQ